MPQLVLPAGLGPGSEQDGASNGCDICKLEHCHAKYRPRMREDQESGTSFAQSANSLCGQRLGRKVCYFVVVNPCYEANKDTKGFSRKS